MICPNAEMLEMRSHGRNRNAEEQSHGRNRNAVEQYNGTKSQDYVSRQQMHLTFMRAGERAKVLKVRGNDETNHHLERLGFVPGESLQIVSEQSGSIIAEIKGTQIALDKKSASRIIVS